MCWGDPFYIASLLGTQLDLLQQDSPGIYSERSIVCLHQQALNVKASRTDATMSSLSSRNARSMCLASTCTQASFASEIDSESLVFLVNRLMWNVQKQLPKQVGAEEAVLVLEQLTICIQRCAELRFTRYNMPADARWYILHPDSRLLQVWDVAIRCNALYFFWQVPFSIAFSAGSRLGTCCLCALCSDPPATHTCQQVASQCCAINKHNNRGSCQD